MARKLVLVLIVPALAAAFVATDFGASLSGPPVLMAQQKKRPGLLRRLFAPRDRPNKATRRRSPSSRGSLSTKRRTSQAWGSRTLCVRTCDGYYFPISYTPNRRRFKIDQVVCKAMYGGAGAELFIHANGRRVEQAVSLTGQPLASRPYAFRYRSTFDESCQHELKSGLAHLEKVFAARIAETKENTPASAEGRKQNPLPVPVARINPSQDPETAANLAGRFAVARVKPMDSEEVAVASIAIRRLGPEYYYIAPATIDTLYDPPDLGPEFSLISSAHAAD
ncbi:MAG: DUF2865 domain-containing protein [Hyphomicrobiales bacterium]|nr:DUF2865 domain-containing protein [Hyphomicrobiales bacterium]